MAAVTGGFTTRSSQETLNVHTQSIVYWNHSCPSGGASLQRGNQEQIRLLHQLLPFPLSPLSPLSPALVDASSVVVAAALSAVPELPPKEVAGAVDDEVDVVGVAVEVAADTTPASEVDCFSSPSRRVQKQAAERKGRDKMI